MRSVQARKSPYFLESRGLGDGRGWDRTNDLFGVNEAVTGPDPPYFEPDLTFWSLRRRLEPGLLTRDLDRCRFYPPAPEP